MNNRSDFDEKQIKDDLSKLFQLLKSDKPQTGQNDEIDKSTLISLMLYLDLQKEEPEFFEYVRDKVNNNSAISEKTFIETLLNPNISFSGLSTEKMASYFKIFDKEKKGSFSCEEFLSLYTESPEYKVLDEEKKRSVEKEIREHFKLMEKDNKKEITPIEFYNIINFNQ